MGSSGQEVSFGRHPRLRTPESGTCRRTILEAVHTRVSELWVHLV